jgi:hypothetical protein
MLLQHGRPPVVLALADAQRLLQNCQQELQQQAGSTAPAGKETPTPGSRSTQRSSIAASTGGGSKRASKAAAGDKAGSKAAKAQLRACQAACRKLHFMLAWANEQEEQLVQELAQLAAAEYLEHAGMAGQAQPQHHQQQQVVLGPAAAAVVQQGGGMAVPLGSVAAAAAAAGGAAGPVQQRSDRAAAGKALIEELD